MILSFCLSSLCNSCSSQEQGHSETIDADELKQLQESGVQVIDIRTLKEYSKGHIKGVTHIDFMQSDFAVRMSQLDKAKPLVIHCASGGRSARAARSLVEMGFVQVYDYAGGFSDWKQRGEEVEE